MDSFSLSTPLKAPGDIGYMRGETEYKAFYLASRAAHGRGNLGPQGLLNSHQTAASKANWVFSEGM